MQKVAHRTTIHSPSTTAAIVAATLLLLRDDPALESLVDEEALPFIRRLVREAVPPLRPLLDHAPWPLVRRLALRAERHLSPGFVTHYALRKHAVRTALRRAVEDGCRQVVLLGAGFDMLSLSVPSSASVFEIDHPGTQVIKRRAIGERGLRNVNYIPVDLAQTPLRVALGWAPGFCPDVRTVFVAEGLLMYLTREKARAVLADIADCARARLIATLVLPDPAGRARLHAQSRVVDVSMRVLHEEMLWSDTRADIATLVRTAGFDLTRLFTTADVADDLGRAGEVARRRLPETVGEVLFVADRAARAARQANDSVLPASLSA